MTLDKLILAAVGALIVTATPVLAANLISNGDFGTGDSSYWTEQGNTVIAGTPFFGFNSPDWGDYFAVFNAGNSEPNGTLAQAIATTTGSAYSLTFNYGVNWYDTGDGSIGQSIIASVIDSTTNDILATTTIFSSSVALVTSSLDFTAESSGTVIQFTDVTSNNTYNVDGGIDNVSVDASVAPAVPEPASWAMMLVGLGAVGFAMRRRASVSVSYA